MARVSIAEAKARFAQLVARAEAGECIVITRHGRPVVQVSAVAEKQAIPYGDLAGRGIQVDDDLSLPEAVIADFEGSEA